MASYGSESDAWRVALAGRTIATTGQYVVSRLPGHPLIELVAALLWQSGPLALNGVTVLFSGLAAAFFALVARLLGCRDYLLAAFALALAPAVFVNSAAALDYLWALAFILASTYCVLVQRPLLAGVLLGAAIGCRVTSGAMLLPLGLLLVAYGRKPRRQSAVDSRQSTVGSQQSTVNSRKDKSRLSTVDSRQSTRLSAVDSLTRFALAACLVGGVLYVPVVLTYGSSFFRINEFEGGWERLRFVLMRMTVSLWGFGGTAALLVTLGLLAVRPGRRGLERSIARPLPGLVYAACAAAIVLYVLAFLRLPHKAAYLIPVVPFALLLLARLLPRGHFVLVCLAIILSTGLEPHVAMERSARLLQIDYVQQVIARAAALPEPSVVLVGEALPIFEAQLPAGSHGRADYVARLDASLVSHYLDEGRQLYYLPGEQETNLDLVGVDITRSGAQPIAPW